MMKRTTLKTTISAALALALGSGAAHAGENKFTKEERVGMLGGAAAGAIVGGPIGAVVGLFFGGVMGDSIGATNRATLQTAQLEQELVDTRIALAKASESTGGDAMLDALAERLHADVMFRTGGAELDIEVADRIAELGKLVASHQQLEVQLHGFADPRGNAEKNLELSFLRANAVRDALINGGAAPDQIRVTAHGEDLTTATKDDLEAYAWERRVTLSIRPTTPTKVAQSQ